MKTFVIGSDFSEDRLAWEVCDELGLEAEYTGEFAVVLPWLEVGKVLVVDVARGIEKVQEVPPEGLKNVRSVTAHDFDFSTELRLALSADLFPKENLVLVGIPMGMEKEEAKKQLQEFLSSSDVQPANTAY